MFCITICQSSHRRGEEEGEEEEEKEEEEKGEEEKEEENEYKVEVVIVDFQQILIVCSVMVLLMT